jgi:pimeloyl-ACP methyl ester carboxylesterase
MMYLKLGAIALMAAPLSARTQSHSGDDARPALTREPAMTQQTVLPAQTATLSRSGVDEDKTIRPFRVHVSQGALDDLRRRIIATRWPDKETVDDASQGVPLDKLQELLRYWGTRYSWRTIEEKLNALPQFTTNIDGVDIQFIQVKSRYPNAMPLIVTHGWPGSIIEQLKIIGPLTDPVAYGGSAEDAFDVVIPSVPGYGFSGKPSGPGWGPDKIARAWGELMTRLGYTRYVAQGGDWGTPISSEMARQKVPGLIGIHINLPAALPNEVLGALAGVAPVPAGLTDSESAVLKILAASGKMGGSAYGAILTARPQTVGYGAADSPAGLAAWVLVHPGFATWKFGDDPTQTLTRDDVLDDITLYWLTNTAASAGRLYWENKGRSPLSSAAWRTTEITLPVAITIFGEDAYKPSEAWSKRAYPSLMYFHEAPKGGHFAAWEQPQLFAEELRAAFRPLRNRLERQ